MKVVNEMRGQEMGITHAVLLHGASQGAQRGKRFATLHKVETKGDGRPMIAAGVVATRSALEQVMGELSGRVTLELIDERVLAPSANAVVWWRKPTPARVWFNTRGNSKLKHRTGVVPQPGLVFAVTESGWFVWAVDGEQRPDKTTSLFQAPYMNVWSGGRICAGQAKLPKGIGPDVCGAYEEAFWSTRFTHANVHDGKLLTAWKGGVEALWTSLLDGKHDFFPAKALVPLNINVDKLLKRLSREE